MLLLLLIFFGMEMKAFGSSFLSESQSFWVQIYSEIAKSQGVVYDSKYPQIVYEKIELSAVPANRRAKALKEVQLKWKKVLLTVHSKLLKSHPSLQERETWPEEEQKAYLFFEDKSSQNSAFTFLRATHRRRLKCRFGQKERFLEAVKEARLYLPRIEPIFQRNKLPILFSRLPYVESYFDLRARSTVGASGIWQLMPSIAKKFIRVDETIDERNDPILGAQAAAQLLRLNQNSLEQNSMLAVTAYNHGRKSLLRGIRQIGSSDLERLYEYYKIRAFGPDSRHFYPQLLSVFYLDIKYQHLFEEIQPLLFKEKNWKTELSVSELIQLTGCQLKELKKLNLNLSSKIWNNEKKIPKKYSIRLPVFNCSLSQSMTHKED